MNNQNPSAQIEQTNTQEQAFGRHRFDVAKAGDIEHVFNAITVMTGNTTGILEMIFSALEGETGYSHHMSALLAAIDGLKDISEVIELHHSAINQVGGAE